MAPPAPARPQIESFSDPALEAIAKKLARGERLGFEDGLTMLRTRDVTGLGSLADRRKSELWGDQVFFVFNRQINPTNACVLDCKF